MWLQATRSNHKMDDNLYHPCMVYLPTFVVDFYGQCRWISIHGILCEWILFKPYLQASMSIKPEEPPSLELIFYFASENSPWFLLTTFDTTWFLLGTKNNRPQNGPQCFGGFHSRHCNPKCISTLALLHQGKYEDAEQVKSGSWVQLRKISKFWGATSRCAAIYESGTICEALWKWQEGCSLKVKWRLNYVCHMSSFLLIEKMLSFRARIQDTRYQKVLISSKHINQSIWGFPKMVVPPNHPF